MVSIYIYKKHNYVDTMVNFPHVYYSTAQPFRSLQPLGKFSFRLDTEKVFPAKGFKFCLNPLQVALFQSGAKSETREWVDIHTYMCIYIHIYICISSNIHSIIYIYAYNQIYTCYNIYICICRSIYIMQGGAPHYKFVYDHGYITNKSLW